MIREISGEEAHAFAEGVFTEQEQQLDIHDVLRKGSHSLAVYVGDDVAGVISVKITWENAHVTALAVAERFQGQGFGRQLLDDMEAWARDKGLTSITLSTKSYQAKDFYLKQGYSLFGQLADVPLRGVTKYHFVKYLSL